MPTYSEAPLPDGLDALVGMGMNRVKLAIAVTLAQHGGSLSTPDLLTALGGEISGSTVSRNLHELEDHGYVTGDLPRQERRRRRTRWTLNHDQLTGDLEALVRGITPKAHPTGGLR